MILYILQTASTTAFERCQRIMQANDSLLCLGDAATLVCRSKLNASHNLYVLKDDIDSRALQGRIQSSVVQIDYDFFVQLAVTHGQVVGWRHS